MLADAATRPMLEKGDDIAIGMREDRCTGFGRLGGGRPDSDLVAGHPEPDIAGGRRWGTGWPVGTFSAAPITVAWREIGNRANVVEL
jgi:hypothetical protein